MLSYRHNGGESENKIMIKQNELSTELQEMGFVPTTQEVVEQTVQYPSVVDFSLDEDERLIADLTTRQVSYCSMNAETADEKMALYNAQNNPEKRLKDEVNEIIEIKDLYVEAVKLVNEETGVSSMCPRIVIIDSKNIGHTCVSFGVYSAIKRIIKIFGEPTYAKPIKVKVRQISKSQNKNPLTLDVVGM